MVMTNAGHKLDFKLTKDTLYLAREGELCGVSKDFGESWTRYNCILREPCHENSSALPVAADEQVIRVYEDFGTRSRYLGYG